MSEHDHGQDEHEPWKTKLSHAFKDLQEADNDRDARLRRNQEAVQRIIDKVLPPVFAQFIKDAAEHRFHAEVTQHPNNKQRLKLSGPTNCQIDFWTEATSETVKLFAQRQDFNVPTVDLLKGKEPEHFRQVDLGEYLAVQLEQIKPKKK